MAKVTAFQIYNLLPKTNCKECGEGSCMAYAVKLLTRERKIDDCPYLLEPKNKSNYEKLVELIGPSTKESDVGITLDATLCTGCGNCVVACPPNARVCIECREGGAPDPNNPNIIFRVVDSKAEIKNLKICRRYEPPITNCRICETYCPTRAIQILR
jgi:4Fe-4S ferredoxin